MYDFALGLVNNPNLNENTIREYLELCKIAWQLKNSISKNSKNVTDEED